MFLDEQLLRIVREKIILTDDDVKDCLRQMISASFENMDKALNGSRDVDDIARVMKRTNKIWQIVHDVLEKEKKDYFVRDAFKLFIEQTGNFKEIIDRI